MLSKGQDRARKRAIDTSVEWGSTESKNSIQWQTYRATCRRDGVWQPPQRSLIDFNDQLAKPILEIIVMGWDKVFHTKIPRSIQSVADSTHAALATFDAIFKQVVLGLGVSETYLKMLYLQLSRYTDSLQDAFYSLRYDILIGQRSVSRSLTPSVQAFMLKIYRSASEQKGKGCFVRTKQIVEDGVKEKSKVIFSDLKKQVKRGLESLLSTSENDLRTSVFSTLDNMEEDYMSMFEDQESTEEQHQLKDDIAKIVEQFERTTTPDVEETPVIKRESSMPTMTSPQDASKDKKLSAEADTPQPQSDQLVETSPANEDVSMID